MKKLCSFLLVLSFLIGFLPAVSPRASAKPTDEDYTGVCGENLTWTVDPQIGVMTISGTGPMYDYELVPDDSSYIQFVPTSPWFWLVFNSGLIDSIVIEDGVTEIGDYAFYLLSCIDSVTLPESVRRIGTYAFYDVSFEELLIPNGVVEIEDKAFYGAQYNKEIFIPESVERIGCGAFADVFGMTVFSVHEDNPFYCTDNNGILYNKDKTELVCVPKSYSGTFVIPETVTRIGEGAFFGCDSLTEVENLENVVSIGKEAFSDCRSLTEVTIPYGIETLREGLFYGCSNLTTINLPDSLTSIGKEALCSCDALESITLPQSVTEIGEEAFASGGLVHIEIPKGVRQIGKAAFSGCWDLKNIVIPEGITLIEEGLFRYCYGLESVTLPQRILSIGKEAFTDCWKLTDITLPEGLRSIEANAFYGCDSLESIHIPSSVTYIDSTAFSRCDGMMAFHVDQSNEAYCADDGVLYSKDMRVLVSFPKGRTGAFAVPDTVTRIKQEAFSGAMLTQIAIPHSVKIIEKYAFKYCRQLSAVELSYGLESIGEEAFYYCERLLKLEIPDSVTSIGPNTFYYCTALQEVKLSEGLSDLSDDLFYFCRSLSKIQMPKNLKTIGSRTFYDCRQLESIEIPESVTSIGSAAFSSCSKLKTVNLPDALTTIPSSLFSASGVVSVKFPSNVTTIEESAFFWCDNLITMEIPDTVTSIGMQAFARCDNLTEIQLPEGMESIGEYAFRNCKKLETVYIPKTVKDFGPGAFAYCESLKAIEVDPLNAYYDSDETGVVYTIDGSILVAYPAGGPTRYTIANTVNTIGEAAFAGSMIEEVKISESVTALDYRAFSECDELRSMILPRNVQSVSEYALGGCYNLKWVAVLNPDCKIYGNSCLGTNSKTTVYSYENSGVRDYADYYQYTFRDILNPDINIYHSINLASDISVNFVVPAAQIGTFETCYMECSVPQYKNGVLTGYQNITLAPELRGEFYYFVLDALNAVKMGDIIESRLHLITEEGMQVSELDDYSVAQYAYGQLNSANGNEKLKSLCANLLRYGAKAQSFKNYRVDDLPTKNLTEQQEGYLTDLNTVVFGKNNEIYNDLENAPVTWLGKTLLLDAKIQMKFVLDVSGYKGDLKDLYLRVEYLNFKGEKTVATVRDLEVFDEATNRYFYCFDGLLAAELRQPVTVAVYEGDRRVSKTLCYSVDTYGSDATGTLGELCRAIIAYSDAAQDFFG